MYFWHKIQSGRFTLLVQFVEGKRFVLPACKEKIGDGKNTRFCEDWWVGNKPLKEPNPGLYFVSHNDNISVAEAIEIGWDNFSFRRTLYGENLDLWNNLKERCEEITMYGGKDEVRWMLTADRKFTVKSLYMFLIKINCGFSQKFLWKIKVPGKVKVFCGL